MPPVTDQSPLHYRGRRRDTSPEPSSRRKEYGGDGCCCRSVRWLERARLPLAPQLPRLRRRGTRSLLELNGTARLTGAVGRAFGSHCSGDRHLGWHGHRRIARLRRPLQGHDWCVQLRRRRRALQGSSRPGHRRQRARRGTVVDMHAQPSPEAEARVDHLPRTRNALGVDCEPGSIAE